MRADHPRGGGHPQMVHKSGSVQGLREFQCAASGALQHRPDIFNYISAMWRAGQASNHQYFPLVTLIISYKLSIQFPSEKTVASLVKYAPVARVWLWTCTASDILFITDLSSLFYVQTFNEDIDSWNLALLLLLMMLLFWHKSHSLDIQWDSKSHIPGQMLNAGLSYKVLGEGDWKLMVSES